MSKYTTGEIARLCGVTVRTVQYYDRRNILNPSELSEGGRRLYTEDDLRRMKLICYLRSLDLPIDSIAQLLAEGNSQEVITLLLSQREETLRQELRELQEKLSSLEQLSKELKSLDSVSLESIGDIAFKMENSSKLNRTHALMLGLGILMDLVWIGTLIYGIVKHIWWPFAAGLALVPALARRCRLGAGLILGGGLSNLWERLRHGRVYDYVRFPKAPGKLKQYVFNLADFAIFLGAALVLLGHGRKR